MRVAAAFRGVIVAPMPAGHRLLALSDVPDRQRRDGPPELVIRRKHPVIPVPVLARGRSASMPRNRFGTEITHCRTGTGGMT